MDECIQLTIDYGAMEDSGARVAKETAKGAAGGRNSKNVSATAIIIYSGSGAFSGFINFADNIHKPGGLLDYNVYKDQAENWNGDHHVNDT